MAKSPIQYFSPGQCLECRQNFGTAKFYLEIKFKETPNFDKFDKKYPKYVYNPEII